jgi:type III secretion protein D
MNRTVTRERTMNTDLDSAAAPADAAGTVTEPRWQFGVFGGVHCGALVDVDAGAWLLIGSAADCDVVLRDDGVHPHHLVLYWQQGQLLARALDASVVIGETPLEQGAARVLTEAVACRIDGLAFGIGRVDSPQWQALLESRPAPIAPTEADDAIDAVTAAVAGTHGEPTEPAPQALDEAALANPSTGSVTRVGSARKFAAVTSAGLTAIAVGVAFWASLSHTAVARQAPSVIASTLESLGLAEVKLVQDGNGHVRLEGTVGTEAQRAGLVSALSAKGFSPSLHVVSGEHLAMTVQDSFRQRGMVVEARYEGAGRMQVKGASPTAVTESVIGEILKSTGSIRHVALVGSPPKAATPAAAASPVVPAAVQAGAAGNARDPKRVIGVIGGEMAYLLTFDGTRYLAGAQMPDGSQVEAIDGHDVTFMREGQRVVVQF